MRQHRHTALHLSLLATCALLVTLAGLGLNASLSHAAEVHRLPAPALDEAPVGSASAAPATAVPETAILAGGCFWGVQGVYQHVIGVLQAVSGYTGGAAATAHYGDVSSGTTGHAESVKITYDPRRVSYGRLLQIYFSVVTDPTELNRQGPDAGTQYRSTLFPVNAAQARIAAAYIQQLSRAHVFSAPIVTTIEPGRTFYPAEEYHQNYLATHPSALYIVINDLPKVAALARVFPSQYRPTPVLVPPAVASAVRRVQPR